jgi:hypothetical protein
VHGHIPPQSQVGTPPSTAPPPALYAAAPPPPPPPPPELPTQTVEDTLFEEEMGGLLSFGSDGGEPSAPPPVGF